MTEHNPRTIVQVSHMLNCGDCYYVYLVKFDDHKIGVVYPHRDRPKVGDIITEYDLLDDEELWKGDEWD